MGCLLYRAPNYHYRKHEKNREYAANKKLNKQILFQDGLGICSKDFSVNPFSIVENAVVTFTGQWDRRIEITTSDRICHRPAQTMTTGSKICRSALQLCERCVPHALPLRHILTQAPAQGSSVIV